MNTLTIPKASTRCIPIVFCYKINILLLIVFPNLPYSDLIDPLEIVSRHVRLPIFSIYFIKYIEKMSTST